MDLKDKVVVVTGASRGLGKAIAATLITKGSKVVVSSQSGDELGQMAAEIKAVAVAADVTSKVAIQNLADQVIEKFGRIDIWINNAGIDAPSSSIENLDIARLHAMLEVNLFGVIYGSQSALVQMKTQHYGMIVNIISRSSLAGRPETAGYSASKWAERGFTESLRLAAKPYNIEVMAVYPAGIKTDLFGRNKPADYDTYMEPQYVADKIVENIEKGTSEEELLIEK
ncbi:MAG: SDR family oxidoreductase [Patescibacteria group bacterium]|nr:SDR family oxidoreductase [Patescibacteria group bacterium]MCL5224381.1 SDR family oxidoreductase [Patescibacteria group bacterium]